jgi:hypothetical protein
MAAACVGGLGQVHETVTHWPGWSACGVVVEHTFWAPA